MADYWVKEDGKTVVRKSDKATATMSKKQADAMFDVCVKNYNVHHINSCQFAEALVKAEKIKFDNTVEQIDLFDMVKNL